MVALRTSSVVEPASDEEGRLEEVADYRVLGTWPETQFEEITQLVSTILRTPMAILSIVGRDKLWMKSRVGLTAREVARDVSFCTHTIQTANVLVVPDMQQDRRFKNNPLVTGDTGIRFYAGAPLVTKNGFRIGALCALDVKPRASFNPREEAMLKNFAGLVMTQLELRRNRLPS